MIMSKYKKYKKTNYTLLPEIPSEWNLTKLKFVSDIYTGDSLNDEYKIKFESSNEDELPYISSKDINVDNSNIEYNNGLRIPIGFEKFKVAPSGSSLLCIEGGSAGRKMGFLNQDVCFVNKLACIKADHILTSKFIYYCLRSDVFQTQFRNSLAGLIGGVSISNLKNFYLTIPPIDQINIIVEFLDHQTSIIDQLIRKKEKLMELLKEKRQSIINEAVTKGLNPNAKMKNSGIEWLGEVPEDWEILKLKYLIERLESGVSVNSEGTAIETNSSERAVLKTSCVFNYTFNPNENKRVLDEEFERVQCPVKKNTIIISRMNTPELVGASGYVEKDYPNLFLPDRLWQTVFNSEIELDVEFISFVLRSEIYKNLFGIIATGTSPSMKNIAQNAFLDLPIPFPKLSEQKQITLFLKEHIDKLSLTILQLERSIIKLKEYRQSIISEAVTGKIDVRDWQHKKAKVA